jgi:hypothetical protein
MDIVEEFYLIILITKIKIYFNKKTKMLKI